MNRFYLLVCSLLLGATSVYAQLDEDSAELAAQVKAESCIKNGCGKSSEFQTKFSEIKPQTSTIQSKFSSLQTKTSEVKSKCSDVKAKSKSIQDRLADLHAKIDDTEVRIVLDSAVLFAFDKFDLRPEAVFTLEKIIPVLNSPDFTSQPIKIEGHTDWVGTDQYNQKLSEDRARSVQSWFASHGVKSARISTTGYGETRPVETNETDAGRQKNRRVEIAVKRSGKFAKAHS